MAITLSSGSGSGGGNISLGQMTPGNFRDVYGFDNAPDNTNLPAIYDREVKIYGNRSLANFLRMVGAEEGVNSRQIRWAEHTRKHVFYDSCRRGAVGDEDFTVFPNGATAFTNSDRLTDHGIRVGDIVLVGDGTDTYTAVVSNKVATTGVITLRSYIDASSDAGFANLAAGTGTSNNIQILVIGNESEKGSDSPSESLQPQYSSYTNDMVIIRKLYTVNGSDANQIGWVQGVTESGATGYYWYMKGQNEERERFEDYLEIQLLEQRPVQRNAAGTATAPAGVAVTNELGARAGTEGLFYAINQRGNVTTGGFDNSGTLESAEVSRDNFDVIVSSIRQRRCY